MSDQLIAAVGASCAVSLVATPTELLKCRLQAQGCAATARQRLLDAGLDPAKVGQPKTAEKPAVAAHTSSVLARPFLRYIWGSHC